MSRKNREVNRLSLLNGYRIMSSIEHLDVINYFRSNYTAVKVYRDIDYICMLIGILVGVGGIAVWGKALLGIAVILMTAGVTGVFAVVINKKLKQLKEQYNMVQDKKYQVMECSIYDAWWSRGVNDRSRDYFAKIVDSTGVKCSEELRVGKDIYKSFIKHMNVKYICVKVGKEYHLIMEDA